ncbi:hypothetical protein D3C71_617840 [compost metagenome]
MSQIYIVARPFRSMGRFFAVGTIIEDLSEVKLGRIKMKERKIIPVPDDDNEYTKLKDYLAHRRGVDLEQILDDYDATSAEEEADEPKEPVTTPEAPSVAEPSAKADSTPPPGTPDPEVEPAAPEAPKVTTTTVKTTVTPVIKAPTKKA